MIAEINPFPDGRKFAVTFVDDTDYSTRANTEPVYDFLAAEGFFGTKTVWPLRAIRSSSHRLEDERTTTASTEGSTLEDPEYRQFALTLAERGFEIGLHGVAAGNSRREEILRGLDRFRTVFGHDPSINAFHRTNIENLYCGADKLNSPALRLLERVAHGSNYLGHIEGTPYFWGDLAQSVFRYVRLPFHTIGIVNTLRLNPSMPFCDPRRPFVRRWFAASDGADVDRFNRLLAEPNVDRLERERGACVIYTHFAKGFARRGPGGYALDREFVGAVRRVTSRRTAWTPTTTRLLDWLDALRYLDVERAGPGLVIRNLSHCLLEGVTVLLSAVETGTGSGSAERTGAGAVQVVLPALSPGESTTVPVEADVCLRVSPRPGQLIRPRERRAIEYCNYLHLLRDSLSRRLQHAGLVRPAAPATRVDDA